jgi:SAM-dependent methyltransferase
VPELSQKVQKYYAQSGECFFDWLYQQVNRQAIAPYFRDRLRRWGRILDAGSGSGHLAGELGLKGAYYLDITWEQLERCRGRMGAGFFLQGDLEHLPFRDGTFDAVISSNVLHYTGLAGLEELLRVTKSGGQLLLSFLEGSNFTTAATWLVVSLGLFPLIFREARFIDLADLQHLDIQVKDSATIIFLPPVFMAHRKAPRLGLVAYELEKG